MTSIEPYLHIQQAYWPCLTPDGRTLLFLATLTGTPQVYRVEVEDGAPRWPEPLTFGEERVQGLWGSPDGASLVYARDVGGDENAQLYRLDLGTYEIDALTESFEDAMHTFQSFLPDGSGVLFAANRRDKRFFDLYLQGGEEARLIWQNEVRGYLHGGRVSPDGRRMALTRVQSSSHTDLIEITLEGGSSRTLSTSEPARYRVVGYADDTSLIVKTDMDADFLYLARLDLGSLELTPLVQGDWDVELAEMTPDAQLLYTLNDGGSSRLYVLDLASGIREGPRMPEPLGVIGALDETFSVSADGARVAFSFWGATHTCDVFLWERPGGVRPLTRASHGGLDPSRFVPPELVHIGSFDGLEVPAWLHRPPADTGTGATVPNEVPAVVVVHGGPEGQSRPQLTFLTQYLVSRGYAVLLPNVRGSAGYGKRYSHLDDVDKRMDSVADLAAAARWLGAQEGIAASRMAVYGGSYGGFMVLAALTTYPELFAAGVNIVGISNFVTFLERTSGYRRAHRETEYGSLEHDRELLERISPMTHLGKLRAPLLILHGANDPRVPLFEAEQLARALEARGVPNRLLVFDDEGHGLAKLKNKRVAYKVVADFLDEHLGS